MSHAFVILAVLALTSVTSTVAQAADEKASSFVLCKNANKNVRSLRVMPSKEGCTATYTKGGVDEVVGSDRSPSSCKSILAKIQDTLESSKWNCRQVGTATLTTSEVVR